MKTEIKVAVIGAAGLIIAAIIGGWLQHRDSPFTSPTSASTASPTTTRDNLAGGLTIEYPPPEGTEVVEGCHITARGLERFPGARRLSWLLRPTVILGSGLRELSTGTQSVLVGRPRLASMDGPAPSSPCMR